MRKLHSWKGARREEKENSRNDKMGQKHQLGTRNHGDSGGSGGSGSGSGTEEEFARFKLSVVGGGVDAERKYQVCCCFNSTMIGIS